MTDTPPAKAPRTMVEWQTIDSAPRNRAVLIHFPGLNYYGNNGNYAGMLVDMGTGPHWMTFGWAIGRDLGPSEQPTMWRELPEPPTTEGEQG